MILSTEKFQVKKHLRNWQIALNVAPGFVKEMFSCNTDLLVLTIRRFYNLVSVKVPPSHVGLGPRV